MTDFIVERGTWHDNYEELRPMFFEHWNEVGMANESNLRLDINEAGYAALEVANMFLGIALKESKSMKIVGYLSILIFKHLHHRSTTFAGTDCFIVHKDYRGVGVFKGILKMFKLAEKILIEEYGVTYLQFFSNSNKPVVALAKRMGYTESDVVLIKKLGG